MNKQEYLRMLLALPTFEQGQSDFMIKFVGDEFERMEFMDNSDHAIDKEQLHEYFSKCQHYYMLETGKSFTILEV